MKKKNYYTIAHVFFIIICLALTSACSSSVNISETQTDSELFEAGKVLFDKQEYKDALQYFLYVKDRFLRSKHAGVTRFYAGECYFNLEQYEEAIIEYKSFLSFFPNDPNAPEAQFKLGVSLLEQARGPERDQRTIKEAFVEIQKVAANYPDNEEFVEKAENVLHQVKDKIARYEFTVAKFYRREKLYEASNNRLLFLLDKYPESIWKDETLYMLGLNYLNLKETKKAGEVFLQLWKEYPEHEESKDIRKKLAELGVDVLPEEEVQTASVQKPPSEEKPVAKSIDNPQETAAESPSESPAASTQQQADSEGYIVLRRDNLVFINLIREDGIEEDMLLEVYRGKQLLGTIKVFEVQEGFSIAEIVSRQGNSSIEEDDKVIIPQ